MIGVVKYVTGMSHMITTGSGDVRCIKGHERQAS